MLLVDVGTQAWSLVMKIRCNQTLIHLGQECVLLKMSIVLPERVENHSVNKCKKNKKRLCISVRFKLSKLKSYDQMLYRFERIDTLSGPFSDWDRFLSCMPKQMSSNFI